MNGDNQHVDGDDYTFAYRVRTVFKPTLTEVAGGAGMVLPAQLAGLVKVLEVRL